MAKRPTAKYDFKAFGQAIKAARTERKESRKKVKEKVIKEPVSKIVTEGTKEKPQQSSQKSSGSGKHIVSKRKVPDCDGSGHGYWEIKYSDGTVVTKNY